MKKLDDKTMELSDDEISFAGKIILPLARIKSGYIIRKELLIVVLNGVIKVCKIEKPLTSEEVKLLDSDLSKALSTIQDKLFIGAPITVIEGEVYFGDLLLIRNEKGTIMCYTLR